MKTSTPDKLIKLAMILVVLGLVGVAGWTSYHHGTNTVRTYGAEDEFTIKVFVFSIDGLAFSSSLVLLWAARNNVQPTWLARLGLAIGITAVIVSNILHAASAGIVAASIAAWPAFALIIAYELLMWIIATARKLAEQKAISEPIAEKVAEGPVVQPEPIPPAVEINPVSPHRKPIGDHDELVDKARLLLDEWPKMSGSELGRRLGISERHGQRMKSLVIGADNR